MEYSVVCSSQGPSSPNLGFVETRPPSAEYRSAASLREAEMFFFLLKLKGIAPRARIFLIRAFRGVTVRCPDMVVNLPLHFLLWSDAVVANDQIAVPKTIHLTV